MASKTITLINKYQPFFENRMFEIMDRDYVFLTNIDKKVYHRVAYNNSFFKNMKFKTLYGKLALSINQYVYLYHKTKTLTWKDYTKNEKAMIKFLSKHQSFHTNNALFYIELFPQHTHLINKVVSLTKSFKEAYDTMEEKETIERLHQVSKLIILITKHCKISPSFAMKYKKTLGKNRKH